MNFSLGIAAYTLDRGGAIDAAVPGYFDQREATYLATWRFR
jgi:hypothetical protein